MDAFAKLLDILSFLRSRKIQFFLQQQQDDEIMISFALVGARVEVSVFEDHIEFSKFRGDEGVSSDEGELRALIDELWSDD